MYLGVGLGVWCVGLFLILDPVVLILGFRSSKNHKDLLCKL